MKSIWTQAQQKYLDDRFDNLEMRMNIKFDQVNTRIDNLEIKIDQKFDDIDRKFEEVNNRFDTMISILARNGFK